MLKEGLFIRESTIHAECRFPIFKTLEDEHL